MQKLLALIDPKAAEKVAAVLLERRAHDFSAGETTASVEPCHEKVCTFTAFLSGVHKDLDYL